MSRPWHLLSVGLLMVCQSTQALALGGIALLLPLIRQDLGLSFAEAGTLSAASGLIYAAMQIPSGYLADRWGPKALFVTGVLGANLMTFTFALIEQFPLMLVNQAASGFFRALIFTPGLLLMQAQFAEARRATASGLFIVGGLAFNVLLNLLGPLLVVPLGWRGLLMVCAVAILVAAVGFQLVATSPARSGAAPLRLAELPGLVRLRVLQWSSAVHFLRHCVVNGWNFWLPTYLVAEKGLTLAAAGVLVALASAATVPANFLGGYVSDQLARPIGVIIVAFLMLGAGLVLLAHASGLAMIIAAVLLVGIFIQFSFGPIFAYPVRLIGVRSAGFVSGFSNTCANVGGLLSAYAIGVTKDATGSFTYGLYGLVVCCLLGTFAALMLERSGRAHAARKAAA